MVGQVLEYSIFNLYNVQMREIIIKDFEFHINECMRLEEEMDNEFPIDLGKVNEANEHRIISRYLIKLLEKIDKG